MVSRAAVRAQCAINRNNLFDYRAAEHGAARRAAARRMQIARERFDEIGERRFVGHSRVARIVSGSRRARERREISQNLIEGGFHDSMRSVITRRRRRGRDSP